MVSVQEIRETERVDKIQSFSLNTLPETEYKIIFALRGSRYAINAHEIYLSLLHTYYLDFGMADRHSRYNIKIRHLLRSLNFKEDEKRVEKFLDEGEFEKAAKIMRNYGFDIPTYQRVVRALKNLYKNKFVEMSMAEPFKKGALWFLPEAIVEKMSKTSKKA